MGALPHKQKWGVAMGASKRNVNHLDSLKYPYSDPLPGIVGCSLTTRHYDSSL